MSTKDKSTGITLLPYSERVKLVRSRLNGLRWPLVKSLPKPQKVQAAEKLLNDWHERDRAHREAELDKWRARRHEVEDALILGDTAKAMALLKALEA